MKSIILTSLTWALLTYSLIHAQGDAPSLKEAVGHRFKLGVGVSHRVVGDPADAALIKEHFQILTPENCMKPQGIQPGEGEWKFEATDRFMAFARANELEAVGHCLVWAKDDRTDAWMMKETSGEPLTRETLLKRIETHVHTVVERYADVVTMWDVVNEAIGDSDSDDLLRDSVYARTTGMDFIVTAFKAARAKDPEALLIYNDYNGHKPEKREKLLTFLKRLKEMGAPVDAYGMQGHFEFGDDSLSQLRVTFDALRKLGIKVVVSELDIDVVTRGRWWADGGKHREELASHDPYKDGLSKAQHQQLSQEYVALFQLFHDYSDMIERVSFWNLHDGQSWLNDFPWKRVNHPLLFDRERQPKPCFDAVHTFLTTGKAPQNEPIHNVHARHRVLVSTDVGGTDPDDIQSMVHLLVYADCFDFEGLVSSPYGPGRKEDIVSAINAYEKDYANLITHSSKYPTPDSLRAITKQGAKEMPDLTGIGTSTEGSQWIIECAQREDPRPLHVLVWGGIEDVAQALNDSPEILPKLRVYFIGGPNKKWSVNAYNYLERNHPSLWIIEANATYRGWFVGGNQKGHWGNKTFVDEHVANHGALGKHFTDAKRDLKMGDTPSVARLLRGVSEDPSKPGWGGQFVRLWKDRKTVFHRHTTEVDKAEAFGVVEFVLPKPDGYTAQHQTAMIFSKGRPPSKATIEDDHLRFRFSPRDAKTWTYVIESDFPDLKGQTGKFVAELPSLEKTKQLADTHPNWWIDDPNPSAAEGVHSGAKSVNQWREAFLKDFAERMDRCLTKDEEE